MARGASRRPWVKLNVAGWLHGSIRWELEAEERSVWADLICLAAECGAEGKIADHDGKPYPRGYVANHLNITPELLERTITKCKEASRLTEANGVLGITNWSVYQSEYERQKKYRGKAIVDKGARF